MIIKAQPSLISFETGRPKEVAVSVVGVAPHKTYYVERLVGYLPAENRALAPQLVGALITHECRTENLALPAIPGVTAEGTWVNPRPGVPA